MKANVVKIVICVTLTLFGLWLGWTVGASLFARVVLWLSGEDPSNVELYNQISHGLPAFATALLGGAIAALVAGIGVERLINRYGVPGILPPPGVDFEQGAINLTLTAWMPEEDSAGKRVTLFSADAPASQLAALFRGAPGVALTLVQEEGTVLVLQRAAPSPYGNKGNGFGLIATLRRNQRIIYSFEASKPGKYWRPEAEYVAFCRFHLSYVGCEEESGAYLLFEGPLYVMKKIFLQR